MKKEFFNILFLVVVAAVVTWLYWEGNNARKAENYILALSWQPAFCEARPNKPECRSQRKGRFDAQNFSLHGLWPQPRDNVYCGVPSNIIKTDKKGLWNKLPKLDLTKSLRDKLSKHMPGYRSNLHRHEWYKHGTCMRGGVSAEKYFQVSLQIMDRINKSPVRNLFAQSIGKEITAQQIIKTFESLFGKGFGKWIAISCKRDGKRTIINELKISFVLPKNDFVLSTEDLRDQAPKLPIGCKRGIVDPVGLQ